MSRRQVSIDESVDGESVWSATGAEPLFRGKESVDGRQIFITKYQDQGKTLLTETPEPWPGAVSSDGTYLNFDLHPDGRRLLVRKAVVNESTRGQKADRVVLFENFFEVLRQKAPSGTESKP